MKYITLDYIHHEKVVDTTYYEPDYVFFPIYEGYKIKIKNNEHVLKEQNLLVNDYNNPVNASVSGNVLGSKTLKDIYGNELKFAVIENDFKEKLLKRASARKSIFNLTKDEVISILKNLAITSLDNHELLLFTLFSKPYDNLIVNVMDDNPYTYTNEYYFCKYSEEVIDTIAALVNIFGIKSSSICIPNNNATVVDLAGSFTGSYPEIKVRLLDDKYLLSKDEYLLKYLNVKESSLIISPKDIFAIYNALKRNRQVSEKIITISGDALDKDYLVDTKIGSLALSVLESLHINYQDKIIFVNGVMNDIKVDIKSLIITSDINSITIMNKVVGMNKECINCGKCHLICPLGLNPMLKDSNKCIHCNLCKYICPTGAINKGDKHE